MSEAAEREGSWEEHCIRIALLLLAGDVQARVVHPGGIEAGIEVRRNGHRVIWGPHQGADEVYRWGWTMVDPEGAITASQVPLTLEASVEDVARAIATTVLLVDLPPL